MKYADEFTIRADRPSGTATELAKIVSGWGDYFFYGIADENDARLAKWILGDLNRFRTYFNASIVKNKGELPGTLKANGDGSSSFRVFKHNEIPGFVIAGKTDALDIGA